MSNAWQYLLSRQLTSCRENIPYVMIVYLVHSVRKLSRYFQGIRQK